MTAPWIEVTIDGRTERHDLAQARLVVGGPKSDVPVPSPGEGELQLWSRPPKVVRAGRGAAPVLNGRAVEEAPLSDGDTLQWGGAVLVFRGSSPVLEELEEEPVAAAATASVAGSGPRSASVPGDPRALKRILAGLLVEQKLADKKAAKRWQEAVMRGEYDADAAAADILSASSAQLEDPKLLDRAGRLERDMLMASFQKGVRGASRRARRATRSGAAFLVANLIAISIYSLLVMALAFLTRSQYGWSFDGAIDKTLETLGGLFG